MAAPTTISDDVFGNSTLFEEFSTTIESCKHRKKRNSDLEESVKNDLEAKIKKLEQENRKLQSWLKVCIQAKGYKVSEGSQDGPIAQVVYMNHDSVCKYRHHIEYFLEDLCKNSLQHHANAGNRKAEFTRPLPQCSSMVLTENPDPASKEAFTATGNVQYFLSFCLDTLGRPLVDGMAELTEGWEIPPYPITFREALPIDEKPSAPSKGNRFKSSCFNCGNEKHSLRDCPHPRDLVRISQNKKLFMDQMGSSPAHTISGRRYHREGEQGKDREMDERFKAFKPGEISDALRQAMGISPHQLPPYIYGMRRLGYPPGHLLDAQVHKSDLKVYNIKESDEEGELTGEGASGGDGQVCYNLQKLIDYPGFNADADQSIQDEWQKYNSVPMQNHQRKEVLKLHLKPMEADDEMLTPSNKRRNRSFHEFGSSTKKRRTGAEPTAVDMDISGDESPTATPGRGWFQPPLPPTPELATPPPLPPGPAPLTPHRDSPLASRSPSVLNSQSSSRSASPDLEKLMSERNKLLAALDDRGEDSAASLSDAVQSSMTEEDNVEEQEAAAANGGGDHARRRRSPQNGSGSSGEGEGTRPPGEPTDGRNGCGVFGENDTEPTAKDSPDSPDPSLEGSQFIVLDSTGDDSSVFAASQEEGGEVEKEEEEELPNRSGVPHRRKFSVNITPHDFDVEEPAKKGIFKKLLNILKRDNR